MITTDISIGYLEDKQMISDHITQGWVLKWGEKGEELDRVRDMTSGVVKECLQVVKRYLQSTSTFYWSGM